MTRSETTEDLDGDPCDEREDHCPADFEDDGAVIGANMVFSSPIGVRVPKTVPATSTTTDR